MQPSFVSHTMKLWNDELEWAWLDLFLNASEMKNSRPG